MSVGSDNWQDAPQIALGETSNPTPNDALTLQPGEPNPYGDGLSAWWKITAAADCIILLDTFLMADGSDSSICVYTIDPAGPTFTEIASNDDAPRPLRSQYGYRSFVNFDAVAGTTYYVQVDGYGSGQEYVLRAREGKWSDWISRDPFSMSAQLSYAARSVDLGSGRSVSMDVLVRHWRESSDIYGDGLDHAQENWDVVTGRQGGSTVGCGLTGGTSNLMVSPQDTAPWDVNGHTEGGYHGDNLYHPDGTDFYLETWHPQIAVHFDDSLPLPPDALIGEVENNTPTHTSWSVQVASDPWTERSGDYQIGETAYKRWSTETVRINKSPDVGSGSNGTLTQDQINHWPASVASPDDGDTAFVESDDAAPGFRFAVLPGKLYSTVVPDPHVYQIEDYRAENLRFQVQANVTQARWRYLTAVEPVTVQIVETRVMPPLRQHPRADGLGASSARRMWPPPRSEQASIRRAGGYF